LRFLLRLLDCNNSSVLGSLAAVAFSNSSILLAVVSDMLMVVWILSKVPVTEYNESLVASSFSLEAAFVTPRAHLGIPSVSRTDSYR
jgi:hypothetical protein